ncbi:MAG: histidine--tRNA ligase [Candidatus Baldrarchaeia archaeon]
MEKLKPLRGMRDFLPPEMIRRMWVIEKIREVFESYGFDPLETPAIERWSVLTRKCGEEVMNQIFKFKDKGGRDVGLRFDLTVPLARIVAYRRELPRPFKRYCISRVWRYEEPQAGRYREFWQADVDIIGSARPEADVEVIAVAIDALKNVGMSRFVVRLNNRKILEAAAICAGVPKEKILDAFRSLDKLDKIGEDGVRDEMASRGIPESAIDNIMEFIKVDGETNEEVLRNVEGLIGGIDIGREGISELISILKISEYYKIDEYLRVDLSLVRGLDYYTGPVFEIAVKDVTKGVKVGSVAGGGRYDTLIELYGGEPTPAVGISIGVERVIEVLNERGQLDFLPDTLVRVFVIPVNDKVRADAIRIAQMLRSASIPTDIELMGRKLGRALEYADKKGIPLAVIVGPQELKEGHVVVRNMKTRAQEKVKIAELVDYVKSQIKTRVFT